jgi:hypothetical protein
MTANTTCENDCPTAAYSRRIWKQLVSWSTFDDVCPKYKAPLEEMSGSSGTLGSLIGRDAVLKKIGRDVSLRS